MTTIARWAPFPGLDAMERRMRRLLESESLTVMTPPADVYETPTEFVVELEVAGYDEHELAIEVSDHMLEVRGERKESKDEMERDFRLHERLERAFARRFQLPSGVDTTHLRASFEKGVLEVHAPKAASATPQKVEITTL